MADRDVTLDVLMRDKTSPAIKSVNRNLKSVEKSWKDVDSQGKRTLAAAQQIASQWGRGFSRISGATSRWANSGDSASKKFVKGIGSGIGKLADLGGSIGNSLAKSVSAAGPYVQVAIAGVLVAAAVAAAPAVGAVIGSAMVGGAAGAGIIGGLIIASKDARVASALDGLKEEIGSGLQDAAKRFVPASLDAVKEARAAFRGLLPDLRRIFDVSATWVAPLTRSFGRAAQLALDGITKAVVKAGPIISAIGDGLVGIGQAVGKVFGDLADNGSSMALALKGVFGLVKLTILGVGSALNLLVEAFEFFVNKIPGGKKLLDAMAGSQDGAKTSALNLAGGFQAIAGDANGAAAGITNLKAKSDEFADSNISLGRAQIASREAIKTTTAALVENSKAKISNKERSDKNMTALYGLAEAFNSEADAGDRSGISATKASDAYHNNRAKLIAMAEKAGYSRTKAEELAASLLKVPKNVNSTINVDTKTATANVVGIKKAINNVTGKTVYINVIERSNGDHYMPGQGTQLKNSAYTSWQGAADSGATSRTVGGPTKVESTVNLTSTLVLDGQVIDVRTQRKITERERRTAFRQKVGKR